MATKKIIHREIVHSSSLSKQTNRIEPTTNDPTTITNHHKLKKTPECGKKWFIKMFFFCPIFKLFNILGWLCVMKIYILRRCDATLSYLSVNVLIFHRAPALKSATSLTTITCSCSNPIYAPTLLYHSTTPTPPPLFFSPLFLTTALMMMWSSPCSRG